MKTLKVAFDVDGTLIHTGGDKDDSPRHDLIHLFFLLEGLGCEMYIWSGGGVIYAKDWCRKLGLNARVVEKGSFRPDIAIDDDTPGLGFVNLMV